MRHKRHRCTEPPDGWRLEAFMCMVKLKRAAKLLEPRAFVATYPNGSYVFDPEWSRARAEFHKKQGARIARIRGVIEPW